MIVNKEIRNPYDFYNNQYVLSLYQDGPLHRPCQYQMMLRIIERLLYKYLSCFVFTCLHGNVKAWYWLCGPGVCVYSFNIQDIPNNIPSNVETRLQMNTFYFVLQGKNDMLRTIIPGQEHVTAYSTSGLPTTRFSAV